MQSRWLVSATLFLTIIDDMVMQVVSYSMFFEDYHHTMVFMQVKLGLIFS
jgi:hypothetical protein